MNPQQRALLLARNIVTLWNGYSDDNAEETESSMRDTFKEALATDLTEVDGVLAAPLKYFASAFLNDENPEDLTFAEMTESLEISIGILDSEGRT